MVWDEAYREAEQRIAEALRTGEKELNLRGLKLSEIPESLGNLSQLQQLNLWGNQLTTLPLIEQIQICHSPKTARRYQKGIFRQHAFSVTWSGRLPISTTTG